MIIVALHITGFVHASLSSLILSSFFVISGYFFNFNQTDSAVIIKKINQLLVPYLFFFFLSFIIYSPYTFFLGLPPVVQLSNIYKSNIGINNPIWFIECLFWCNIILLLLFRLFRNFRQKQFVIFSSVALSALCGFYLRKNNIFLPMHFTTALVALPLFYFGLLFKNINMLAQRGQKKFFLRELPVGIFLLGIVIIMIQTNGYAFWQYHSLTLFGSPILAYILPVLLVSCILLVFKPLPRIPFLEWIGQSSLIVLGMHMIVGVPVMKIINTAFIDVDWEYRRWISFTITLILSITLIPIIKKIFPHAIGVKPLINSNVYINNNQ